MNKIGIYIHIPFCKKKCSYCDFISFSCYEKWEEEYVNCIIEEIMKKEIEGKFKEVSTIYIGGGTPSIIDSKNIIKILETIKNRFNITENTEITIEVNPGTVTKEKLDDYKKAGVNRISIGLQTTHNRILNLIGRIHSYEQFIETYDLVQKVGFENINVDLMLAIPTQTESELIESVKKVIELNPNHISLYSLIVEENTELEKMIFSEAIELIDDKTERKMYWKTKSLLEKNGYNQYEISNFAKKGYESKHNLDCWNQEEYIGFGVAAHSYINNKRYSNIENLEKYIELIKNKKINDIININEIQNREIKAKEFMMLGFRKIEGVSISEFERRFRINPLFYFRFEISKLEEIGLIEVDLDNIKLTKKGLDLANKVFEEFI